MYFDKTKEGRLRYIDAIKGMCMAMVLIDHVGFHLPPMLDYTEVPSFFLVSGFLYKDDSLKYILKKKALRLIVPYFLFSFLYAVPYILEMMHSECDMFGLGTVVWFFLSPANEPLWFLKVLFLVFIIYKSLLLMIEKISNKRMKIVAFTVFLILLSVLGKIIVIESPLFLSTGILQAFVVVPLFAIGNILARINIFRTCYNLGVKRFLLILFLSFLWFVFARSNIALHAARYDAGIIEFYIASVAAFVVVASILYELKYEFLFYWLGRNSLYILGLHLTIITTLQLCGVESKLLLLLLTIFLLFPAVCITKWLFPLAYNKSK